MTDLLEDFLAPTSGEPLVYGHSDCAPWVLRWVEASGATVPPIPKYADQTQALRLIRVHGGVARLYAHYAARCGLVETRGLRRGDIGLIAHPRALTGVTGAICTAPDWWAFKRHDGKVQVLRTPHLIAWRVPGTSSAPRKSPG